MGNWYKIAQTEPDIFDDEPIEEAGDDNLVKNLVRNISGPDIDKATTKGTSETFYDVEGVTLRLWIIVGGTPALAFEDYSFTERYPIKDNRWIDWDKDKEH